MSTKRRKLWLLMLRVALTSLLFFLNLTARAQAPDWELRQQQQPPKFSSQQLKTICSCESTGRPDREPRHFDGNGNVLRGKVNPQDIGACQINLFYHEAKAKSMGLDLFSEDDNIAYANWLYSNEGAKPWVWSQGCWDQN